MYHAQRPQRFDEHQFRRIEIVELAVTLDQCGKLLFHVAALAGEAHPQILYRGPGARIVEVHEMRPLVRPQHVAGVAVAMQPQRPDLSGPLEAARHAPKRIRDHAAIGVLQVGRHEIVVQNEARGLVAEAFEIQLRAVLERPERADRVDARDEAPEPRERIAVFEFGAATGPARIEGETVAGMFAQGLPTARQGCYDRNLALGQFQSEGVLLKNGRIQPARRPIEFRHQRSAFIEIDEIDAVLETVERDCSRSTVSRTASISSISMKALRWWRNSIGRRAGWMRPFLRSTPSLWNWPSARFRS